jgi:hypothetical protein
MSSSSRLANCKGRWVVQHSQGLLRGGTAGEETHLRTDATRYSATVTGDVVLRSRGKFSTARSEPGKNEEHGGRHF